MDVFVLEDKLYEVYELVKKYTPETDFDKVELIITAEECEQTRYNYNDDDENGFINGTIFVALEEFDQYDSFITNYYNKTFNMNLEHNFYTALIRMLCHECGHHVNYDKYKYRDEEYFDQLCYIDDCTGDERRYAYRQIDQEYDADLFSANFLKEHLDECLEIMNREGDLVCTL